MRFAIIATLAVMLAGCNPQSVPTIVTKFQTSQVPASILRCDPLPFPKGDFKSNKEVAQLLLKFYQTNQICAHNMAAVKQYLATEGKIISQ